MKSSLIREKLRNLDSNYVHPSYALERKLLKEIELGYLDEALLTMKQINSSERPTLAKDHVRSIKNSLIASCTLFTRAAIRAGINPEDAFDLSDVFIKHIETLEKDPELTDFESEMVEAFIQLIHKNRNVDYPYPVSKVVKMIYENATRKLSLQIIADEVGLSPDYLSKIFHKEVGMTITDYIQAQKIEVAKHFLSFTDMSVTEISTLLEFCNPGYFSSIFKKHVGASPLIFRREIRQNM